MKEEQMPIQLDMLIFGAHPDDAEIGMGGTIHKHTILGKKVGICDLTQAELSTNGSVDIRQVEASLASDILGLYVRTNLGLPDRGLYMAKENVDLITLEIRKYRPKVIFAPYWEDRHPDHVACSKLVQEAVFNAKLRNYLPQFMPWHVDNLYFYFINDVIQPEIMIDISEHVSFKQQALMAYKSQFTVVAGVTISTPLNQGYLQQVEAKDRILGQRRSLAYAEGFISKLPYLTDYL